MKTMRQQTAMYLFLFALCAGSFFTTGLAQELKNSFLFDDYDFDNYVEVSDAEYERLSEIKDPYDEKIGPRLKQMREIEEKVQQLKIERDFDLESALPEALRNSLHDLRLAQTRERARENRDFLKQFAEFSIRLADAEDVVIYQGLPRVDPNEPPLKTKAETIQLDGYDFYAEPLKPSPLATEALRSLLVDYTGFGPYGGGKFCGGFHSDLCVTWSTAGKPHRAHICLGCGELLVVGPTSKTKFDYTYQAREKFIQIDKAIAVTHE